MKQQNIRGFSLFLAIEAFVYVLLLIIFVLFLWEGSARAEPKPYQGFPVHTIRGFTGYVSLANGDIYDAWNLGANTLTLMLMVDDLLDYRGPHAFTPAVINPAKLRRIKRIVRFANSLGMLVNIDMHEFPGWAIFSNPHDKDMRMWDTVTYGFVFQNQLVTIWGMLAQEFAAWPEEAVAFQTLNEPSPKLHDGDPETRGSEWDALQARIHAKIRSVDTRHLIILSPPYNWRLSCLNNWTPAKRFFDGRTAVNIRMYEPHDFTHQDDAWWHRSIVPRKYPGWFGEAIYEGRPELAYWNAQKVYERLALTAGWFQYRHKELPLVCTETSAIRIAPGSAIYLRDVIRSLKILWIGWTYHCWREKGYFRWKNAPQPSMWDLEAGDTRRLDEVVKGFHNLE